jgi:hypothetical protein
MRDRQTCIDCGKQSPETETNYTLISAQFGWRLSRRRDKNGDFIVEWRCAECWREHKKKMDNEAPSATQHKTLADKQESARRPVPPPLPRRSSSSTLAAAKSSRPPSKIPPSTSSRPPSQAPPSEAADDAPRATPASRPRRP